MQRRTVIVAVFESREALIAAVEALAARGLREVLDIGHAALVARAVDGSPVIQNNNVTAVEGALSGGMIGAALMGLGVIQAGGLELPEAGAVLSVILGLLAGGGLGSLIGYWVAVWARFGFDRDFLAQTAAQLQPGEVALVLHVRAPNVDLLRQELQNIGVLNTCAPAHWL